MIVWLRLGYHLYCVANTNKGTPRSELEIFIVDYMKISFLYGENVIEKLIGVNVGFYYISSNNVVSVFRRNSITQTI